MSRKIQWQRCFSIPKKKLDLFLVKLQMSANSMTYFEAAWIFQTEDGYDVVVEEFSRPNFGDQGTNYPFVEDQIVEFVEDMWTS